MTPNEAHEVAAHIAELNLRDFPVKGEAGIRGIAKAILHLSKSSGFQIAQVLSRGRTWRRSAFLRIVSEPVSSESFANYVAAEVFNHQTGQFVRLTEEIAAAGQHWQGTSSAPESRPISSIRELDQEVRAAAKQKGVKL